MHLILGPPDCMKQGFIALYNDHMTFTSHKLVNFVVNSWDLHVSVIRLWYFTSVMQFCTNTLRGFGTNILRTLHCRPGEVSALGRVQLQRGKWNSAGTKVAVHMRDQSRGYIPHPSSKVTSRVSSKDGVIRIDLRYILFLARLQFFTQNVWHVCMSTSRGDCRTSRAISFSLSVPPFPLPVHPLKPTESLPAG